MIDPRTFDRELYPVFSAVENPVSVRARSRGRTRAHGCSPLRCSRPDARVVGRVVSSTAFPEAIEAQLSKSAAGLRETGPNGPGHDLFMPLNGLPGLYKSLPVSRSPVKVTTRGDEEA
jgi:hypothetical protein